MAPMDDDTRGTGGELAVAQNAYELFSNAVTQVESGQSELIEFLTYTHNPVTGESHTYSELGGRVADPYGPAFSETVLNDTLSKTIAVLTDEVSGRKNIEDSLNDAPDYREGDYDLDYETQYHEWQAATKDVVIGVKTVVSDRGILQKTWYVANAPIRERLLPQNRLARAVVLFIRPELNLPQESTYFPTQEF